MLLISREKSRVPNCLLSAEQLFWRFLCKARLISENKQLARWQSSHPVVSFTFDDFPSNAFTIGGEILREFGARGTYFACLGWMGRGDLFTAEDLRNLIAQNHELGCHTYSHTRAREVISYSFGKDIRRNSAALSQVVPNVVFNSFSYPGGQSHLPSRHLAGKMFKSCRGNTPGICHGRVNLAYLAANRLYHREFDSARVGELIRQAAEMNAWLIFYTHDVDTNPSQVGCKPGELRTVVEMAIKSGAEILTMHDACLQGLPSP